MPIGEIERGFSSDLGVIGLGCFPPLVSALASPVAPFFRTAEHSEPPSRSARKGVFGSVLERRGAGAISFAVFGESDCVRPAMNALTAWTLI